MTEIRRFSDAQLIEFQMLIAEKPADFASNASKLADSAEAIADAGDYEIRNYTNRRDLADQLLETFGPNQRASHVAMDRNMWSWLAAAHAPSVMIGKYSRKIGSESRWIPIRTSLRFHRHAFEGPFLVALANRHDLDAAMAALATDVMEPGEVAERVTGKAQMAYGAGMALATYLYYDTKNQQLKRGVSAHAVGGARRLSYFLSQIDLTLDYPSMSLEDLLALLPDEFDAFRS